MLTNLTTFRAPGLDKFEGDVNAQWNFFSSKVRDAQETCVPQKTISEKTRQPQVKIPSMQRACKEDAIIKDAERMQGGCKIVQNVNVQA